MWQGLTVTPLACFLFLLLSTRSSSPDRGYVRSLREVHRRSHGRRHRRRSHYPPGDFLDASVLIVIVVVIPVIVWYSPGKGGGKTVAGRKKVFAYFSHAHGGRGKI